MNVKKICKIILFVGVVLGVCVLMYFYGKATESKAMQQDIAKEVIRLHVVANSDSDEDQKLKLEVKEQIVKMLREEMNGDSSVAMAKSTLQNNLGKIEKMAREYIEKKGYNYSVKAQLGDCYFPVKTYGDMTFPAGTYEALKVNIGEASGRNWWCIMYPSLCFVDSTYQTVPDSSKEKLKENLTDEEYKSLLTGGDDVEYGFKIGEYISDLFN